tara:strand:- start:96 stop:1139 length:1044 start_codon:yes stop_codon:yes gene_type:complete
MGEKFQKKSIILISSVSIVLSSVSLISLILFWPQKNPFSIAKVTISSKSTLRDLSQQLYSKKIISNEKMFVWAVQLLGKEKQIPIGTFRLVNAKSNFEIIDQLVYGSPEIKKITILEGWSLKKIANYLNEKMDFDQDEISKISNNQKIIKKYGINASSLEGYLYPDTYLFFNGDSPNYIINHLLEQFKKFWTNELIERAKVMNMSIHEIVTLASIIEGEAIYNSERPTISGVYHNRLKKGMLLQADPTIQYIINDGPRRLLNKDLRIDSPYNTYKYPGLPPGPINSPGKESLMAALYPEQNDYLFFVANGDGYHTFSKNERDHNIAKRKFQKIRNQLKRKNEYKKVK